MVRVPAVVGLALAALPLCAGFARAQTLASQDRCVECHLSLDEDRLRVPAELYPDDVHGSLGFDCLSCHGRASQGPGSLDPSAGFLAAPDRTEIAALCGRCHSDAAFMRGFNPSLRVDQVAEYESSGHGRALRERGDPDVATCVSCHPAHRILPPTNSESSVYPLRVAQLCADCHGDEDLMRSHDLPADQLAKYRESVHGRMMFEAEDLTAPTCNDCHGNHGAAPPGVSSVRNVCGQCHAMMAEFFSGSGHEDVFEAEDLPGCATCHGHHAVAETSDELLVERSETLCSACHAPGDPSGDAFRTMKHLIDSLEAEAANSREVLSQAEDLGMEVSEALFELDEVGNALVKARTAIHALKVDPVAEEISAGLQVAETAMNRGEEALYEHWFRRAGLALSATVILGLVVALVLKIRQIEVRAARLTGVMDDFFSEAIDGPLGGAASSREPLRLAAWAVLLEMIHSDDDFDEEDRSGLDTRVVDDPVLTIARSRHLLDLVHKQRARGVTFHEFADLCARRFPVERREALLEAILDVVRSEPILAGRERSLMDEAASRVGIDSVGHHARPASHGATRIRPRGGP